MSLTLPWDFTTETVTKERLQEQFDALAAAFGQITNSDILAKAGIAQSKLADLTANIQLEIPITIPPYASGWPDGSSTAVIIGSVALESDVWTVKGWKYHTTDVGDETNTMDISWGYIDGSGTYIEETEVVNAISIAAEYSGEGSANVALGSTSDTGILVVRITSDADSSMMSAMGNIMTVTILLQRAITI